nr:very-short-patch mismatch repair endonuclease [uncultured archaeon]
MTDIWSEEKRSEVMSKIRGKDTKPELEIRRLLAKENIEYIPQAEVCGWTVDFLIPNAEPKGILSGEAEGPPLILEYRSCFWHKHGCGKSNTPKSNRDYWIPKLERNKERDTEKDAELRDAGYEVEVIWGCEDLGGRMEEIIESLGG